MSGPTIRICSRHAPARAPAPLTAALHDCDTLAVISAGMLRLAAWQSKVALEGLMVSFQAAACMLDGDRMAVYGQPPMRQGRRTSSPGPLAVMVCVVMLAPLTGHVPLMSFVQPSILILRMPALPQQPRPAVSYIGATACYTVSHTAAHRPIQIFEDVRCKTIIFPRNTVQVAVCLRYYRHEPILSHRHILRVNGARGHAGGSHLGTRKVKNLPFSLHSWAAGMLVGTGAPACTGNKHCQTRPQLPGVSF